MKQFQYTLRDVTPDRNNLQAMEDELNSLGQKGFELVAISRGIGFFKRPLTKEEELCAQEQTRPIDERKYIIEALQRNNGRQCEAAREMNMSYRTFLRRIKQYNLEPEIKAIKKASRKTK